MAAEHNEHSHFHLTEMRADERGIGVVADACLPWQSKPGICVIFRKSCPNTESNKEKIFIYKFIAAEAEQNNHSTLHKLCYVLCGARFRVSFCLDSAAGARLALARLPVIFNPYLLNVVLLQIVARRLGEKRCGL